MTTANPYAADLGDHDALEIIGSTPAEIERLWRTLGPEGAERETAPGKWTVRETFCHLADTELAFAFRLRQALAETDHVIQPFDQTRWSDHYASYDAAAAVAAFAGLRRWNLALVHHVMPGAADKPLTHPERGPMTFRMLLETMAGHDVHHLGTLKGTVR
jgi:uncharacterized damage-inducible protein DinB